MKISNKMQHFLSICFRSCFIILSAVILVLFSISLSFAGNVTFVKEYTYQASELDSKASCRTISLEMVKRLLLEELGTYLISETEVKDFKFTKEQVKTYSAGIVGAEIIEDKWDGKTYWLKAKVSADPKEVQKSLKKIIDDKYQAKQLEETRKKAEELTKEVERLNKELAKAEGKQPSKKIKQEYKTAIQGLTAIEWFEKGQQYRTNIQYDKAIEAYTIAIALNPNYEEAYNGRGLAFYSKSLYDKAIKDFSKVINLTLKIKLSEGEKLIGRVEFEEDSQSGTFTINYAEVYYNRGLAYNKKGQYDRAIEDFDKGIDLNPNYPAAYNHRGLAYSKKGQYDKAIENYNKAIAIYPDYANAYNNRGLAYSKKGKYDEAIKDYNKAIAEGLKKTAAVIEPVYEKRPLNSKTFTLKNIKDFRSDDEALAALNSKGADVIDITDDYIEPHARLAEAYYNRGFAYYKLNNEMKGVEDLKKSAKLGSKEAQDALLKMGEKW